MNSEISWIIWIKWINQKYISFIRQTRYEPSLVQHEDSSRKTPVDNSDMHYTSLVDHTSIEKKSCFAANDLYCTYHRTLHHFRQVCKLWGICLSSFNKSLLENQLDHKEPNSIIPVSYTVYICLSLCTKWLTGCRSKAH